MKEYLLDTNMVSFAIKRHPIVIQHMLDVPMTSLCISAITEGELRFGLAKRPEAKRLFIAAQEFLKCVDVLPWDSSVSQTYATVRADMEILGKIVAPLDMLIAAHAMSVKAILVSNDKTFHQIPQLALEDWTTACSV